MTSIALLYIHYIFGFLLYSERNNPNNAKTVPTPDINVIFSFRTSVDVTTVITGTK